MSFTKYDKDKVRPTLFPVEAIENILPVLEYGAQKYAVNNWRKAVDDPDGMQRYRDAFERHWMEYKKNPVSVDSETGIPHLYHAACNIIFLTSLEDMQSIPLAPGLAVRLDKYGVPINAHK